MDPVLLCLPHGVFTLSSLIKSCCSASTHCLSDTNITTMPFFRQNLHWILLGARNIINSLRIPSNLKLKCLGSLR
jgi:hypothetical protein